MFSSAALIAAPLFVDIDGYKNSVLTAIKDSTGLEPKINGQVDVTFFPLPTIKLRNITIGNEEGFSKTYIAYIEKLEIESDFYSLLMGDININQINLISPIVELEENSKGNKNWSFLKDLVTKKDSTQVYRLPSVINIVNGSVSYSRNFSKNTIDYIFAKIEVDDMMSGPFLAEGNFSIDDEVIHFNANMEKVANDAKAKLLIKSNSMNLDFAGRYKDGDNPTITGIVSGGISNLDKFSKAFFDDMASVANINSEEKVEIKGMFELSHSLAIVKDLSVNSPSIKAVTQIETIFSHESQDNLHWDISINIDKIDLDTLYKEKKINESEIDYYEYTNNKITLSDFKFNVPKSLSTVLYFKIAELNYSGGVVRDLIIDTDIYDGKANIKKLSATLPGNSFMTISGSVDNNGTRPIFDGSVNIKGSSLRDAAVWMSDSFDFVPKSNLEEYTFSADMVMTPQKINFSNANLYFDKSLITAEILIRPASTIPLINIDMSIDGLNFDQYGFTGKINQIMAEAIRNTPKNDTNQIWFKNFNSIMDFNLTAKDIIYNGYNVNNNIISLSVAKNLFSLNQFVIDSEVTKLNSRLFIHLLDDEKPKIDLIVKSELFNTALFFANNNAEDKKMKWSEKPFNFLGLHMFNGNAKVVIRDFKHLEHNLSNVIIDGTLENEIFNIKKVNADLNGGKLNIKGQVVVNEKNPSIALSLSVVDIDLIPLVEDFNQHSITNGSLTLAGVLKSSGVSPYQWILNMDSKAKFMLKDALFNGFDLSTIIKKSINTYSVIDMNAIVQDASASGSTMFDYIYGDIVTEKSILKVSNANLKNVQSKGVFAGNLSMINFDLNGTSKIAFKPEKDKQTHLDIGYSGNIYDIKKVVNTENLEQYITEKGAINE